MFGTKQKIQEAERYGIAATRAIYRKNAFDYFHKQIDNMRGKGSLAWLRGGLDLAVEIGLISIEEEKQLDTMGSAKYEAMLKAEKEYKERKIAEYEAERAAKAKAARGE